MRMRTTHLLIASVLALGIACRTNNPPGVQWERTFQAHDTWIRRVVQTHDGGFIAAGSVTPSRGEHDVYLQKFDVFGNMVWQKSIDVGVTDFACWVEQTQDGGFALAGGSGDSDKVTVFRMDSTGNQLWLFSDFWGATSYTVEQTCDGGYVTGGLWSVDDSLYILKLDSTGRVKWRQSYDEFYGHWNAHIPVRQTSDGGYIMAAEVLLKTNAFGDQVWKHRCEDVLVMFSVCQTPDGGFVATGIARAPWPMGYFKPFNMVLLKTYANGDLDWKRVFTDGQGSEGRCVRPTSDGGFVVSGSVTLDNLDHARVVRTDSQGNTLWTKTFEARTGLQFGQQTSDGGYILCSGDQRIWKLGPGRTR
jgi:hypothetical protein